MAVDVQRICVALLMLVGCRGDAGRDEVREPKASSLGDRRSEGPAPLPARKHEHTFSVASYNINFGNGHLPETIETIAALDVDVVLLQETTEASEAAIRSRLGAEYRELWFHHCCRAGGLGVLSRYPLLDAEVVDPEVGFFPAAWLRLDTPAGPLVVANVHLRPPISDGGSWVVGFFSTQPVRAREIAALWRLLPKDDPIVLAGDFNEEVGGMVVDLLRDEGQETALPQFAKREPTWHWNVGKATLKMQLDHVTYGTPLRPLGARVVRGGLSDHEPVVVELAWPVPNGPKQ